MYNKICKGVVVGHVRGEQSVHKNYKDMFVGGKVGGRKRNVHEKSKRMFIGGKVRGKKTKCTREIKRMFIGGKVRGRKQKVHNTRDTRRCLSWRKCEEGNQMYTTHEVRESVCRRESAIRKQKHANCTKTFAVGKL